MALEERKFSSSTSVIQNLILENREKLSISGVLDVLSFDDQVVIIETELGLLTIKGENLKISKLSLDRIQYDSDKNELANNVLKFNEVVDSFTKGMNSLEEE